MAGLHHDLVLCNHRVIVLPTTAVLRSGRVWHQRQVEEPVSQADENRLDPRPDLRAHPPVQVRSTWRGGRDPAAQEQCQAYRGHDSQYPRSCHTGVSLGIPLPATGKPACSRNGFGRSATTLPQFGSVENSVQLLGVARVFDETGGKPGSAGGRCMQKRVAPVRVRPSSCGL